MYKCDTKQRLVASRFTLVLASRKCLEPHHTATVSQVTGCSTVSLSYELSRSSLGSINPWPLLWLSKIFSDSKVAKVGDVSACEYSHVILSNLLGLWDN